MYYTSRSLKYHYQFINKNMSAQKQSRVDLVEKKIKALTNVMQGMMDEMAQMRDLSVGTLETIKLMPDYGEALEKLKETLTKKEEDDTSD